MLQTNFGKLSTRLDKPIKIDMAQLETEQGENLSLDDKLFALISPFHFTSTDPLRELMRNTGMVISGSTALALTTQNNDFFPNDIDLYVLPPGFPAVLQYVEDHGYKIEPSSRATANYYHQNIIIVKLTHPVSHKTVNVMSNLDSHVVKCITRFHSTVVMNYVSWFGLVVLYPEWTLQKRGLLLANTSTSNDIITKYVNRGYSLHRNIFDIGAPNQHRCGIDPYCPSTTRSLHDSHCFIELFEPAQDNFTTIQRDMTWTLPVPCSFDAIAPTARN